MQEEKVYNKLKCGCQYNIAHYGDVVYCKSHKTWDDVELLIGADVRRFVQRLAKSFPTGKDK